MHATNINVIMCSRKMHRYEIWVYLYIYIRGWYVYILHNVILIIILILVLRDQRPFCGHSIEQHRTHVVQSVVNTNTNTNTVKCIHYIIIYVLLLYSHTMAHRFDTIRVEHVPFVSLLHVIHIHSYIRLRNTNSLKYIFIYTYLLWCIMIVMIII